MRNEVKPWDDRVIYMMGWVNYCMDGDSGNY